MKNRFFSILLISIIVVLSLSMSVYAQTSDVEITIDDSSAENAVETAATSEPVIKTDTAGNVFAADASISKSVRRDLYWIGQTMTLTDVDVTQSILAAGRDLIIRNTQVGGSIRTGSYSFQLNGTTVDNNITSAGYNLSVDAASSAKGVFLAGYTVTFNGEADAINLAGETVFFNGTVHGDGSLSGSSVTIGPDAVVEGSLTISAPNKPSIPESASIGKLIFNQSSDSVDVSDDDVNVTVEQKGFDFLKLFYKLLSMLVVTVFFCLFISSSLNASGSMLVTKPVAMLVSGFIAMLAAPMLVILLCVTVIGIPVAILIILLLVIVCCYAVPFAGASLGRLIFKNMKQWLSALIGTAILVILRAIPYLGSILLFLAIVYTLGYYIQTIYNRMKNGKETKAIDVVESVAPDTETL